MRDTNLDNTDADIDKAHDKIKSTLSTYNITVERVIKYIDSTVFLLSPNSIENMEDVKKHFGKKDRYELEYGETDMNREVRNETGDYIGRMPLKTKSIVIRRLGLKKLPRPILLGITYLSILVAILAALCLFMYRVVLL